MQTKLKKAGFHDGGIIKKATGEDGIILANSGEAVLTKDEVVLFRSASEQLKTLQDAITPVNYMVENMQNLYTRPQIAPVMRNMGFGDVTVQVDVHGNMDNVTLPQLKQVMKDTMNNTLKATPDYMWREMRKFGSYRLQTKYDYVKEKIKELTNLS